MNAAKFFVSSAVAASVVAVIGMAYAQTPPSPTSPTTSPGMQETNPPLATTPPASNQRNNTGNNTGSTGNAGSTSNNNGTNNGGTMNAPATGSPRDRSMNDRADTMRNGGTGMSNDAMRNGNTGMSNNNGTMNRERAPRADRN